MLLWAVLLVTLLPINKTFGQEAYAVFADGTLTLKYDDQRPTNAYSIRSSYNNGWSSIKTRITKVVFADSFKDYPVTSCYDWFSGCNNLTEIVGMEDNLNTANVSDISYMFYDCYNLTSLDLSGFDTKNVTSMSCMFYDCSKLKTIYVGDNWTTDNVTDSYYMFVSCDKLYGSNGSTPYDYELTDKTYAKIDGGETSPGYLTKSGEEPFVSDAYAILDNGTLTFYYGKNKPDNALEIVEIGESYTDWKSDVTKVVFNESFKSFKPKNCKYWFDECANLTEIIGMKDNLNTQNVTNMSYMFYNCSKLTSLDLSGFDTQNVTNMSFIFSGCSKLKTIYVGDDWTTDNVTDSYSMFDRCYKLYGGKGTTIYDCQLDFLWDRQSTDKTYAIIDGGETSPGYLTKSGEEPFVCDAYAVLDNGTLTFYYGKNKPDNALDIGEVGIGGYYADWKSNVTKVVFNESFKNYKPKNSHNWFNSCNNLTEIEGMKENLNTSDVKNMSGMFYDCKKLTNLDLSGFDTKNVTRMDSIFGNCSSLTNIDLNTFDIKNVTNMSKMFYGCSSLTSLDLSEFDTKNVTSMNEMFGYCRKLKTIYVGDNWTTDNVTGSYRMFDRCYQLYGSKGTNIYDFELTDKTYAKIDGGETAPGYLTKSGEEPFVCDVYALLENGILTFYYNKNKPDNAIEIGEVGSDYYYANWKPNVTKVVFNESFKNFKPKNSKNWFNSCNNLTEIEGMKENLNTSDVKNMSNMFYGCNNLSSLDLSGFDTKNVTSMNEMFGYCRKLKTIYVGDNWATDNVTSSYSMFYDCNDLIGEKGTSYNSQNTDKKYAIIDGGESAPGYLTKLAPISIAIETAPQKEYIEGEKLNLSGGELLITYNNSTTEKVALSKATISGFDNTKIGEQIIKVSFLDLETEFKIIVAAKSPVSIEISTLPTKLEYIIKEDLDLTGGELLVTYNNSTTEKVELSKAIISGFDNKKYGEQTIKVSYLGLETSFIVSIAIKPIAIAIAYYPQISYVEGENFSPANGSLRVIYNNSKIDTVALSVAVVEGYNPQKIGEQILTISYLNLTTELKVNVNPKQNINPYLEPKLVVNIYYISSFEELFWFMFDVNHGDVKANAALVNDIIINKDCLKRVTAMLNTTSKAAAAFATWQPIGTPENPYRGTFDGQGHTISGLYIDDNTTNNVGLFGNVAPEAVIKNLGVTDSYIAGNENVGAICGKSEGTVVNCYTVSEVKGSKNVNPLVGAKETVAVVENCYYLAETPVANDPCAKTAEEFLSGNVAQLLSQGAVVNGVTYSGETFAGVTELPGTDIIPQPENNDNPSTPISSISENNIKVWSYNHTIYIENAPADTKYTIIDLNGRIITTSTTKSTREEINTNKSGIMILNIGNQSFKITQ